MTSINSNNGAFDGDDNTQRAKEGGKIVIPGKDGAPDITIEVVEVKGNKVSINVPEGVKVKLHTPEVKCKNNTPIPSIFDKLRNQEPNNN